MHTLKGNVNVKLYLFSTFSNIHLISNLNSQRQASSFISQSMKNSMICSLFLLFCLPLFSQHISINELMYRRTTVSEEVRFIELHNTSNSIVDLSNYKLEGSVYYTIPQGTSIQANGYLLIAENPSAIYSKYTISSNVQVLGPWIGDMTLYEGDINLHDDSYQLVDNLSYSGWHEWPSTDINSGRSIQKLNPLLTSSFAGSWDKERPTPGALNSIVYQSNYTQIPILQSVTHTPNRPESNEEVVITASIPNGLNINNLSVSLDYQIVEPGQFIQKSDTVQYETQWTTVNMNDEGVNGDATDCDNVWTATLPASLQLNRRLIRYRIRIKSMA